MVMLVLAGAVNLNPANTTDRDNLLQPHPDGHVGFTSAGVQAYHAPAQQYTISARLPNDLYLHSSH
jgi:hypothetical protein